MSIFREPINIKKFQEILINNPGMVFFKFGAQWCKYCKNIEEDLNNIFEETIDKNPDTLCVIVDADDSFDIYALMKTKKIFNVIPTTMCFYKGNLTYFPDEICIGSDMDKIKEFFDRCREPTVPYDPSQEA
jgi:thioredoxin-like negative regulator of GroEL